MQGVINAVHLVAKTRHRLSVGNNRGPTVAPEDPDVVWVGRRDCRRRDTNANNFSASATTTVLTKAQKNLRCIDGDKVRWR